MLCLMGDVLKPIWWVVTGLLRSRASQLSRDRRLEIRKGKDEVWLKGENFWNVGRSKGRNARLLPPDSRGPHGIAGNTDDAVLLTEKVERFDRLLRRADDPGGWKFAQ